MVIAGPEITAGPCGHALVTPFTVLSLCFSSISPSEALACSRSAILRFIRRRSLKRVLSSLGSEYKAIQIKKKI